MAGNLYRRSACMGTLLLALTAQAAHALPTLTNGGFEDGFIGWTRADGLAGSGTFSLQSGTTSPLLGDPVPAPPGGSFAAMTDADAPGAHVLYQDFTAGAADRIAFDLYIGNRADRFAIAPTAGLDFSTAELNQQVRIDIMLAASDPFSVASGDILLNLYTSLPGDPLEAGYDRIVRDVSALMVAHAGETLRLRFAETDNLAPLQLGVDNVAFTDRTDVPAPQILWLLGSGMLATVGLRGRRGRTVGAVNHVRPGALRAALAGALLAAWGVGVHADTRPLAMLDPSLQATTYVSGLTQPIGALFIGPDDVLVLEKASGRIKRVLGGVVQPAPVLDLAVNSNSERGLLSAALDPEFASNGFIYVFWTESSTGSDSADVAAVPLLGNRVDRFHWDGTALSFVANVLRSRSRQTDNIAVPSHPGTQNPTEHGNHNGGVIRFGPDGKLYVFLGDQGRRGWLQNLANGPFLLPSYVDDTFGGPAPDNAHLAGAVLRLNRDGSTPSDNPFFAGGAAIGGEVGANAQKIYSYGHRNSFAMAFDPLSGSLWLAENADDAYSELNRVMPGMNGGWIQLAGPLSRVRDWRTIEATQFGGALQQVRYPPTRAVYTPAAAGARMLMLPGAVYVDPQLSWRYEIGPAGAAFVSGAALGPASRDTLWFGSARSFQQVGGNGGSLYRVRLTPDRLAVDTSADPRLADRVADNLFRASKFDGTESETLKVGEGFGTTTDLQQGPDGNLYVVSITDGVIYKVSMRP